MLLKTSSDDLILFGEDLIKDVLSDAAQVQVIIEAYKEAPKLDEIYEELCKTNESTVYSNIKRVLKNSETNGCLELCELFADHREILKHFVMIINSIQTFSKQNFSTANNVQREYLKNLLKLDVSYNYLTDQIFIGIVENVIAKCSNIKHMNFSRNMITIKSIKALNECPQICFQVSYLLLKIQIKLVFM